MKSINGNTIRPAGPDAAPQPPLRAAAVRRLQRIRHRHHNFTLKETNHEHAPTAEINKGLAGVVVDTTAISKVVPETNSLTYRGYPVQDLAAHCSFEQVAYLLWHGELPTDGRAGAVQPAGTRQPPAGPVDAVAVGQAAGQLPPDGRGAHRDQLSGRRGSRGGRQPEAANYAKSLRMFAVLPTIVAVDMRRRRGLAPIAPHSHLGLRRELPATCASARCPNPVDRVGVRAVDDPLRRAQLQRLHLRRTGGDVDPVGHLQRGDRRRSAR